MIQSFFQFLTETKPQPPLHHIKTKEWVFYLSPCQLVPLFCFNSFLE